MICYASAPCGAGKTHQLVKRAAELARSGERILFVQPTTELIEKTVKYEILCLDRPPRHHVFHGGNTPGSVASALVRHLKETDEEGQIVFITHSVLPFVPYWPNKSDWHVLIDEDIPVARHHCHRLPHTHQIITDHLEIEPLNAIYGRVIATDEEELRAKARNKGDDELFKALQAPMQTLSNRNWDKFVNIAEFEALKAGSSNWLSIHAILKPDVLDGFGSVFITGANFEETFQHRLWSEDGVHFQKDPDFASGLRFPDHPNGELIDIHYVTESPWSKRSRDAGKLEEEDTNNLFRIARAAEQVFAQEPFLWQANKGLADNLLQGNGCRLPNKPHGLNSFAHINNIVFLSALNPRPDHYRFLKTKGLNGGDVRDAVYHSATYQSIMRCSIRDPNNRERKIILVPDRGPAEYLQTVFPGSRVHKLDAGIIEASTRKPGRPKRYDTNKERVAAYRARAKAELARIWNEQLSLDFRPDDSNRGVDGPSIRNEKAIRLLSSFVTDPCSGTLFKDEFTSWSCAYVGGDDPNQFAGFLSKYHRQRFPRKEDIGAISPAIFDPNRPGATTIRGRDNIVYVRHLFLDFENGDLRPEQFAALFPHVRLIAMNTFNNRANKPRFRIVILTDRPLTPDAHELLFDNVVRKLEDAGYFVSKSPKRIPPPGVLQSGLDYSKRTAASVFKMPSLAGPVEGSFFKDFDDTGREILNPLPWIENSLVPPRMEPEIPELPAGVTERIDEALVHKAIEQWRQSKSFPGQGNDWFFALGLELRKAGMTQDQVRSTLQAEAAFGRHPRERRAQIGSIMGSLRKTWRRKD